MPRSRKPSEISSSLHQRVSSYALAASAAGASLIAFAPPADARIVYTPANSRIQGDYPLDLNNDGTADFRLLYSSACGLSACALFLAVNPLHSTANGAVGTAQGWFRSAVAVPRGARIGPTDLFNTSEGNLADHVAGTFGNSHYQTFWRGQWANGGKGLKNGYLGLRFMIKGRRHYGWARIGVKTGDNWGFTATLTGYAYETVPKKPIIAGKTKGPEPATLGRLALGRK